MEAEDVIPLPEESDRDEGNELSHEVGETPVGDSLRQSLDETDVEEGQFVSTEETVENAVVVKAGEDNEILGVVSRAFENGSLVEDAEVEEGQFIDMDLGEDTVVKSSLLQDNTVNVFGETIVKADNLPSENGGLTEFSGIASTSGVKRTRTTCDEPQPSVQVKYYGLSRGSKQKLEELLRGWSMWHAQNSSQRHEEYGATETGEETYFPALDIGTGKNSAVAFCIENQTRKPEDMGFIPMEDASVPLYDRGFSLGSIGADGSSNMEGGLEFLDAPRCFNCSSYSHSLRECPKPRDNDAVNNSRKQLKSKRNQTAGMRNSSRYYQDTPGGKYEGLRPGSLDAETRRLLGLGESDPPPWLNRMREIGYPPGYLDPDVESLPSGITIFADEDIKQQEAGEILESELGDVAKKMSVKYPGINGPIPENADENLWAARPSNPDRYRNGDSGRFQRSSESNFRGRFREQNNQDSKDDDPLGFDRPSRYSSRYGDHDFNSTSRNWKEGDSRPRSPSHVRSTGERARNDPSGLEDAIAYRLYSSFSYSSDKRLSENNDDVDVNRERDDRHRRHRER